MNLLESRTPSNDRNESTNFLRAIERDATIKSILAGLTSEQKYISSKYFYDELGSRLFDKITCLPEYYLTRTEIRILLDASPQIAGKLKDVDIIELGSGDSTKITILLESILPENMVSVRYMPVDVNESAIKTLAQKLSGKFPGLRVNGIIADFETQLAMIPRCGRRLFCFFGSTLGNFSREGSRQFFSDLGKIMAPGDMFLLGVDMVKSRDVLDNAYNDSQQVTAAFNRNILNVINKRVGTNFHTELFDHIAFYNEGRSRIEMYLRARKKMEISSPYLSGNIMITEGESIHTENSHKFTNSHIESLAEAGDLEIVNIFTDKKNWFSVIKFQKEEESIDA